MSNQYVGPSLLIIPLLWSHIGLRGQESTARITPQVISADALNYASYDSGATAEEIVASGANFDAVHNCFLKVSRLDEDVPTGHDGPADPVWDLKALALNSDVVVVGTPKSRQSSLTASHKFVFSDYDVVITQVLFDLKNTVASGNSIVVSRPGGVIDLGGHEFRAIDAGFPLFRLGQQYLFFLHQISSSSSYSVKASAAFLLSNGGLSPAKLHGRVDTSTLSMQRVESEIKVVADQRRGDQ